MTTPVTINSLQNDYLTYLQAQSSQINAFSPNTYWSIQAGAMAATLLDLYGNLNLVQNSIYVQNSQGNQCDLWLYSRGLTARGGQTYGTIDTTVISSVPVTIPANTIFTDNSSNNQYQTLQEVIIPDNVTVLTLYAIQPGNNYIEPTGATLAAGNITVTVLTSTNGQLLESDQSCIARTLQSVRVPQGGSRTTDYFEFCLQSNQTLPIPLVTNAIIEPNFITINSVNILGAFVLVGTAITEYQLNKGLLPATTFVGYSRQAPTYVINNANTFIQSQRLVGLTVITGTTITYLATNSGSPFNLTVSLVEGYTLSTPITVESQDNNDNPITITLTVTQLIQRETRRAICNQPFGGVNIGGQNYITTDSIIYALNIQLSATNGALAQILTNISTSNADIVIPNLDYSGVDLYYTYDVTDYSDIEITAV
jgi:hypothetical protein